jgi:EAL domain-containing protein (putative c-di-GMP-specific phosphodiesterase class I)
MTVPPSAQATILFVDDDISFTDGLRRSFRKSSLRVLVANSASEALLLLEAEPVDVIISDQRMPGVRGNELLAQVRERFPDTARIMLTGQASLEEASDAVNRGGLSGILLKPCTHVALVESIDRALEQLRLQQGFQAWRDQGELHDAEQLRASLNGFLQAAEPAFQPVIRADGSLFGYEALARSAAAQFPGPAVMYRIAAELGCTDQVDAHYMQLYAARLDELPDGASLLVNVNPHSIEQGRMVEICKPLEVSSDRIVIEVTEQAAYADVPDLTEQVAELRSRGYRIALDDLGAGYAGLTAFTLLLPDIVKLDMELLQGLETNRAKAKLIEAMSRLCTELGLLTLAEGIETASQFAQAARLGCDLFQGYYLGKPGPVFAQPNSPD